MRLSDKQMKQAFDMWINIPHEERRNGPLERIAVPVEGGAVDYFSQFGLLIGREMHVLTSRWEVAAWGVEHLQRELTAALARADALQSERDWTQGSLEDWKRSLSMTIEGNLKCIETLVNERNSLQKANENLRKMTCQADDECTRLSLALLDTEKKNDGLQRKVDAIKRYATTENCDVCPAHLTQHCADGGCLENVFKALAEARKVTP